MRVWSERLAISCLLLIPCLWLPLVSSGDLQSHLYNAWLASLIGKGDLPGLALKPRTTNALVDPLLQVLVEHFGASAAERAVAATAVLSFFWGALVYLARARQERPEPFIPWLAIFSYGFVFQLGLINCYISIGVVLWCMIILNGGPTRRRLLQAAPLFVVALVAHPIPPLWFAGTLAYQAIASRLPPPRQAILFVASLAVVILLRAYVVRHFMYQWGTRQFLMVVGANQPMIYGWTYWIVALPLGAFMIHILWNLRNQPASIVGIRMQIYVLTAAIIAVVPTTMRSSETNAWAGLIAERLSLFAPILVFALPANIARRTCGVAGAVVAVVYFALLRKDLGDAVKIERKMEALIASLPRGRPVVAYVASMFGKEPAGMTGVEGRLAARVVALLQAHPGVYVLPTHLVSRACIGRCFDYANYEPSTGQFRVLATSTNAFVTASIADAYAMEAGYYVVKDTDPALHLIHRCGPAVDDLCIRPLRTGESIRDASGPFGQ